MKEAMTGPAEVRAGLHTLEDFSVKWVRGAEEMRLRI
jgi:hypothetical protein